MKLKMSAILLVTFLITLAMLFSPTNQAGAVNLVTLNVVGLYSETAAGSVSYRVGTGDWTVVKVGDKIPNNAEILVPVDRDWVELSPSNNSNAVYEIIGSEKGKVLKKVANLLKQKSRIVSFPKGGDKIDPKFANKVVVKEYLGRQVYQTKTDREDIKYGAILEAAGIQRKKGGIYGQINETRKVILETLYGMDYLVSV